MKLDSSHLYKALSTKKINLYQIAYISNRYRLSYKPYIYPIFFDIRNVLTSAIIVITVSAKKTSE